MRCGLQSDSTVRYVEGNVCEPACGADCNPTPQCGMLRVMFMSLRAVQVRTNFVHAVQLRVKIMILCVYVELCIFSYMQAYNNYVVFVIAAVLSSSI